MWRYRHTVLALCTAGFFATMVARLSISPVVPDIAAAFDSSTALMGLALTGMWAAYALMQFPSGVLADRFGVRTVILTSITTTALATLLLATAPNFTTFALFVIVLGAGAGLHYTVATTFVAGLFTNTARAIGTHSSGGSMAGLFAPIGAAFVGVRYGWRWALLLGFAVAVPIAILFALRVRRTPAALPNEPMRSRLHVRPLLEMLTRRRVAFTTLLAFVGSFVWQATASFLPTLLVVHHGLSTAMAGLLFSVYFVVQGSSVPLVGWVSDRIGRDLALGGTLATGVFAFTLLTIPGSISLAVVSVVLCGISMSWSAPLHDRHLHALSDHERNTGFGLVRTVYMLLGSLGSVVTGALADVAGWAVAIGFLSVVLGVAVLGMVVNRVFTLGW